MRIRTFTFLAIAALLASPIQAVNRYVVTIDEGAKKAHVEASLNLPTNSLAMFGITPAPSLPNGQADLIDNLNVTNGEGATLTVKNLGEGDYEVPSGGPTNLTYDVRLEHEKYAWPAGVEEVAYHTTEGLMITGSALFFAPGDRSDDPIEVEFRLPKGWKATTPWIDKGGNHFEVPSRRELVSNALFLGTATPTTLHAGGIDLTLLIGSCCRDQRELFSELLQKQLASYLQLFGAPPRSKRYLIIINAGDTGDGGAFTSSFSQFIRGTADPQSRVIWGHVMAHELLHFWNGMSLTPADSHEEWFKEGVTDYLTLVTMSRNGIVDANVVRNRLENYSRRLVFARLLQGLTVNPRDAGEKKQENRLVVYAGGSLAAMAIDVEIRKATRDQKGLPDLMRELFAEFGSNGKSYGFEDLVRVGSRVAGHDLRPLLMKTVASTEDFDVNPYLSELGLRRDHFYEEQFITESASATAEQKARYRAIFGKQGLEGGL